MVVVFVWWYWALLLLLSFVHSIRRSFACSFVRSFFFVCVGARSSSTITNKKSSSFSSTCRQTHRLTGDRGCYNSSKALRTHGMRRTVRVSPLISVNICLWQHQVFTVAPGVYDMPDLIRMVLLRVLTVLASISPPLVSVRGFSAFTSWSTSWAGFPRWRR